MESDYKIDELLVFARERIKNFDERYEMFLTKAEDLIGKKVISIRSGFSGDSGQVMIIDKMKSYNDNEPYIHLMPCEESSLRERERENHLGWGVRFAERQDAFIFYKPKEKK